MYPDTQSGPLGGDAQIAALMCMEDLGALIFFVDPLSAHRKCLYIIIFCLVDM